MRKCIIILFLFSCIFISVSLGVMAANENNDLIVEDSFNYFTDKEIQEIEEVAKTLPETYKYYIIPNINDDTDIRKMADCLFDIKGLSQDTIFIMAVTDVKKIHITTGDALQKKHLDDKFFNYEINNYFVPVVQNKKSISQGLIELSKGISKDIPQYLETDKSSLEIPKPLEDNNENNSNLILKVIIFIGLIVVLLLTIWVIKKNYYNKIN